MHIQRSASNTSSSSSTAPSRSSSFGTKFAKTAEKPKSKAALKIEELEQKCIQKDEQLRDQKYVASYSFKEHNKQVKVY